MAIYKYPQEVHEFVREHSEGVRNQDLADMCNAALGTSFTTSSMRAFRHNHGYKSGLGKWSSEEYWKYQKKYPPGMFEFVRDNSWGVSSKRMAEMVNERFGTDFTPQRMKCFRARNKIKSGETGWYQKGHEPATKGKTLEEICKNDPEKIAKVRSTQFKKGQKANNELPLGTVVVNTDGYKLRKKSMTGDLWDRWEPLHRAVWEEHNGPIPPGMIVSFRDNNRLNCDIDNLMLITKGENSALTRLGYRSEDPDLTDVGLNVIRLRNAVEEKRKKTK